MWSDKIKVDTKVCFYFCVKINLMIVIIWQVKEINSYYHIDKYKTIQELNKQYRNIDKVTDVISFANCDDPTSTDYHSLGEIFICVNRAKEQAKEYKHSLSRELAFLAVHGYLHLCGFDHMTKEDEEVMFKIQDDILDNAGVKRWVLIKINY